MAAHVIPEDDTRLHSNYFNLYRDDQLADCSPLFLVFPGSRTNDGGQAIVLPQVFHKFQDGQAFRVCSLTLFSLFLLKKILVLPQIILLHIPFCNFVEFCASVSP